LSRKKNLFGQIRKRSSAVMVDRGGEKKQEAHFIVPRLKKKKNPADGDGSLKNASVLGCYKQYKFPRTNAQRGVKTWGAW